jgi:hypothetical protein
MTIVSGKRYFNDMLWAQAYNNNTLLKRQEAKLYKGKRIKESFF